MAGSIGDIERCGIFPAIFQREPVQLKSHFEVENKMAKQTGDGSRRPSAQECVERLSKIPLPRHKLPLGTDWDYHSTRKKR